MASIYGFTLKNRKTFQGLDWQGNQGNLHYEGKKLLGITTAETAVRAISSTTITPTLLS